MKKTILIFIGMFLAGGVYIAYFCPIEVLVRILSIHIILILGWNILSFGNYGKYIQSAIRGVFWGIQLKSIPKKFRVEKDVTIFNPKYVSFGKSCNIGKGAVFAPLGG